MSEARRRYNKYFRTTVYKSIGAEVESATQLQKKGCSSEWRYLYRLLSIDTTIAITWLPLHVETWNVEICVSLDCVFALSLLLQPRLRRRIMKSVEDDCSS